MPIVLAAMTGFIVNLLSFSDTSVEVPPLKMTLADYPGAVTLMDTSFPGLNGDLDGLYENYKGIIRDVDSEVKK